MLASFRDRRVEERYERYGLANGKGEQRCSQVRQHAELELGPVESVRDESCVLRLAAGSSPTDG